jgi:hypothetical protein
VSDLKEEAVAQVVVPVILENKDEETIDFPATAVVANKVEDSTQKVTDGNESEKESNESSDRQIKLDDWNLESPSPQYDRFYREKRNVIREVLKGGKLPLARYEKELVDCKVDVLVPIYDLIEINKKMQEVQGCRDRIKEIQMHCSKQYFKWETSIQLLEGLLCRVQRVKPSEGRDGIVYEHLVDMKYYFDDLKHIYRSSELVSKTLDNAFECLSRHLTIALPNRPIERLGTGPNVLQQATRVAQEEIKMKETISMKEISEIPETLKDFDALVLEVSETTKVEKEKTTLPVGAKQVDWSDIK